MCVYVCVCVCEVGCVGWGGGKVGCVSVCVGGGGKKLYSNLECHSK